MDDDTIMKMEEARGIILKCSELSATIDKNVSEIIVIETRLELIKNMEVKVREDVQFATQGLERILRNKSVIKEAQEILFKYLGIGIVT